MRAFVAGATGAIGRRLVPQLLEAGHEVTAMTRSQEGAARLREGGAAAVVCDVFDAGGVRAAVAEAAPEVVVHQLTALPERIDMRDMGVFDATNRVRTEGTRVLLDAALAAGARRFVAQSLAFAYVPGAGEPPCDEETPLYSAAALPLGGAVKAIDELERDVTGTPGIEGIVLRYGWLYGPGTYFATDGSTAAEVREQHFAIIGAGTGVYSFIHVEDAAAAAVAAVERGGPGIYNVVDDAPAPVHEWLPFYAEAIGAPEPPQVSEIRGEVLAGSQVVELATSLRGAANAKAKRELGWQPRYASWRDGFATCSAA
ncbi:MAG TPA: NAD(P)-dependent oxidoreductase [Conexibacter sp.]|nr:NAD(P)-dependent oxidoreductase [Conexibacter sp.]